MSAKIIPFPARISAETSLPARLAERRAYRHRCREIASEYVAAALKASAKGSDIGISDALPLFVAAMRRELRKTGLF